jgi:hypothetical protein
MTKVIFALHFYMSACPSSLPAGDVSSSSQRDSTGLLELPVQARSPSGDRRTKIEVPRGIIHSF